MAAEFLRIHGDISPRALHVPDGYATSPRSATRRTDFRIEKGLLDAIIGLCWGDSRYCKASLIDIGEAAGIVCRRTIRRQIAKLIKLKLIARRPDPGHPGGPWLTHVLTDPKGFELSNEPRQNWRVVYTHTPDKSVLTPGQKCPNPRTKVSGAIPYRQPELPLDELPENLASLPEGTPDHPSESSTPKPARPESPDPYRGPRNPGRAPEGYRWVYGQGKPKDGARPGLEPEIRRNDSTVDDPEGRRLMMAIIRARGDEAKGAALAEMERYSAVREKETGCGASLESPPQPAGVQVPRHADPDDSKHTVKACSGQETSKIRENGQCPPRDSNPERAD